MKLRVMLGLAVALPWPALAEGALSGAEFDNLTRDRTLEYHAEGAPVGTEVFQPGRRVVWSPGIGECLNGHWFEAEDRICFVYEDDPAPHCWRFFADGGTLTGLFEAEPDQVDSYEVRESIDPVFCPGVDIEV